MSDSAPAHPAYPIIADPARPAWHFAPPAQWMNDPNGVSWHDGYCHVFYQHNPHGDEWADMHWAHARSRDLIHWEHLPLALRPQLSAGELHCYSGCLARTATSEPRILYTSVPPVGQAATQVLATPTDSSWDTWTQHVATPFLDLKTHDGPAFDGDWRDPFVFHAEGRTFLVIGATLGDEAVVALYENPSGNLADWRYRGILLRAPRRETAFFECPNLLCCGDSWVLLVSPCRAVEWFTGTLDLAAPAFRVRRHGRLDEGADFYATHTAADPQGRTVLFGWARNFPKNRGWNGCLATPRRLWLDDAGNLCSEPVPEIAAIRGLAIAFVPQTLSATPLSLALPGDAMCEGELAFQTDGEAQINISLAGAEISFAKATLVKIRWLLDRSLLEIFVNGRAHTQIVPFPPPSAAKISAVSGHARLVAGHAWALNRTQHV